LAKARVSLIFTKAKVILNRKVFFLLGDSRIGSARHIKILSGKHPEVERRLWGRSMVCRTMN
jgi:hypothetical protein